MSTLDKKALNARQIIKYANSKKLIDAVSEVDTIYNGEGKKKGTYNKKVVLTVNEFGIQGHKEKYAAFYWDIEDALLICDDIVNNRFESESYAKGSTGIYSSYGGGKAVSRILQIGVKDGNYIIQISLYKAIVNQKTGAILPDKNNKIDSHNIQLSRYDARKFFKVIQAHIESKMDKLTSLPSVSETPASAVTTPEPQKAVTTPEQPASKPQNDLFDPFGSDDDPFA